MKHGIIKTALLCAPLLLTPLAQADELSDLKKRVAELEAKMKKGDDKNKRKIKSLKEDIKAEKDKLRISGFATAGFTKADNDFDTSDRHFTKKFNYSTDTKAAVQADYKIDEHWSATIQLMGRAFSEWDTKTEWAFIKYAPTDQLAVRVGRLRFPFYFYSESLDVGFVYPWVRPPMPYYVTSISNYEGIDATYKFATGNITHEISVLTGATKGTLPSGLVLNLDDLYGLTYTVGYKALSWRAQAMRTDVDSIVGALGLQEDRIHYYTTALTYDDGTFLVMLEAWKSPTEWNIVRSAEASQLSIGYHYGDWTPYISYSKNSSYDEDSASFPTLLPPTHVRNTAMGVMWQVSQQVNIKAQYDHLYDIHDFNANFSVDYQTTGAALKEGTDVYTINVNAVF